MSNKLNSIFPETTKIFSSAEVNRQNLKNELPFTSNFDVMTRALDLGKTPKEIQFFHGGVSKRFNDRLFSQGLDDSSTKSASYFMNEECRELLKRNKLMIHIEIRNTFFDNKNS